MEMVLPASYVASEEMTHLDGGFGIPNSTVAVALTTIWDRYDKKPNNGFLNAL